MLRAYPKTARERFWDRLLNVLAVDHSSDEVANGFAARMFAGPTPQRGIGFTTTSFGEIDLRTGWPLRMTEPT
jgi:hypothetical protein